MDAYHRNLLKVYVKREMKMYKKAYFALKEIDAQI